jgi:hypothetical protein
LASLQLSQDIARRRNADMAALQMLHT